MLTNGVVMFLFWVITTIVPLVAPARSGPVFVAGSRYWKVIEPVVLPGWKAIEDGTCTTLPGAALGTLRPPTWPSVTTYVDEFNPLPGMTGGALNCMEALLTYVGSPDLSETLFTPNW